MSLRCNRHGGWKSRGVALLPVLLTLSVLLGAALQAVVRWAVQGRRARQRARAAEALTREVAWAAAAAQRWAVTPAALGGGSGRLDFAGLRLEDLGLQPDPQRAYLHRSAHGTIRVLPVPACEMLDGLAERHGAGTGRGALLVIGWQNGPSDAVSILVMGPLVALPLARVPWGWVRALMVPPAAEDPSPEAATQPADGAATPAPSQSTLLRRRASRCADRPAASCRPSRSAVPTVSFRAASPARGSPAGHRGGDERGRPARRRIE